MQRESFKMEKIVVLCLMEKNSEHLEYAISVQLQFEKYSTGNRRWVENSMGNVESHSEADVIFFVIVNATQQKQN